MARISLKRTFLISTLLIVAIGVLAACGGTTPSQTESGVGPAPAVKTPSSSMPAVSEPSQASVEQPTKATEDPIGLTLWVANGMEDSLSVVDLVQGTELTRIPAGVNPHILASSPDGRVLYVVNAGGHDRSPTAHADMEEATPTASESDEMSAHHQQGGMGSGQDADIGGMSMETMDMDVAGNSLWAIDTATGEVIARVAVGQGPTHPIPSPDGRRVYVTNTDEGSVSVIDTATWQVIATVPQLPEPHDGELTPDGRLLYLATAGDSTMTVVDTATLEVVRTFPVGAKPRGLTVGGDNGSLAYITNKGDGTLTIIDVPAGQVVTTAEVGAGAHAIRVSPDGRTAYIALSKANAVAIVDAQTGAVQGTIPVGSSPEQLDLSPDGHWLAVSNNGDASVSLIDLEQGVVRYTIPVGQGAYGVQFIPMPYTTARTSQALPTFTPNQDGFMDISVDQLAQALANKDFSLVNVHIPYEGELPQTDLFIPFNEILDNLEKLPGRDAPIVVYCRSGAMSTVAAQALVQAGYTQVYELDGGFNAWQAAGHELIRR